MILQIVVEVKSECPNRSTWAHCLPREIERLARICYLVSQRAFPQSTSYLLNYMPLITNSNITIMSTVLATTVPRKTAARLAKPAARYWKGKAPKGADELPSDSEEEDEEQEQQLEEGDEAIEDIEEEGLEVRQQAPKAAGRGINVALRDVNISRDGKVIVAGRDEVGRTKAELGTLPVSGGTCNSRQLTADRGGVRRGRGGRGGRQAW